jgi:hypothetical protein
MNPVGWDALMARSEACALAGTARARVNVRRVRSALASYAHDDAVKVRWSAATGVMADTS